jgi:hypothetical protein
LTPIPLELRRRHTPLKASLQFAELAIPQTVPDLPREGHALGILHHYRELMLVCPM